MSLQNRYGEFHNAIKLTRESPKYRAAREKDDTIKAKVEKAFRAAGYDVLPSSLQGSLATDTGIVPLDGDYDIDRGLAITRASSPDDPVEPKKIIKAVLSEHGFSDPRIKKPCVTADYKADPMHIDYTTYRVDAAGQYQLAVGKENAKDENRSWDDSAPKALIEWIKSPTNHMNILTDLTSAQRAQFRRIVRYLKRWRDFKYQSEASREKVFSIALTVMLKESFRPCEDEDGKPEDNRALRMTLDTILDQKSYLTAVGDGAYNIVVNLPVLPYRDVFDGKGNQVATILRNRLNRLRNTLVDVEGMTSEKAQCKKLRDQFGDDFPEGTDDPNRVRKNTAGSVGVSSGA